MFADTNVAVASPIATLSTACGPLLFTDHALKQLIHSLSMTPLPSSFMLPSPVYKRKDSDVKEDVSCCIDGWSIDLWVQHAKRKSRIASRMCRLDGELKAKLAALSLTSADVAPNCDMRSGGADTENKS